MKINIRKTDNELTISGGKFIENSSSRDGGAIYMKNSALTVTGGSLTKKSAQTDGAGVYLNGTNANISGILTEYNK